MSRKIQVARGSAEELPALDVGEFGYCMDTKQLFIGTGEENREIQTLDSTSAGPMMATMGLDTVQEEDGAEEVSGNAVTLPDALEIISLFELEDKEGKLTLDAASVKGALSTYNRETEVHDWDNFNDSEVIPYVVDALKTLIEQSRP